MKQESPLAVQGEDIPSLDFGLDFTGKGQNSASPGVLHRTEMDQDGESLKELQSGAEQYL